MVRLTFALLFVSLPAAAQVIPCTTDASGAGATTWCPASHVCYVVEGDAISRRRTDDEATCRDAVGRHDKTTRRNESAQASPVVAHTPA